MKQFSTKEALFEALKARNSHAQVQFYRNVFPGLCVWSNKIVRDPEMARTIATDRFWKYLSEMDRWKNYKHLVNALYRTTKHRSLNYVRKVKDWNVIDLESSELEEQPDQDTENAIRKNEVLAYIREIIAGMEGNEKIVAQRAYLEGKTSKDIAELLNKSTKSVENMRTRIIAKIKEALRKGGFLPLVIFLSLLYSIHYTTMENNFKKIGGLMSSSGENRVITIRRVSLIITINTCQQ